MLATSCAEPSKCSTFCICAAVSPRAPTQVIASAVVMLDGETTRLPASSRSRRNRSKPKALLLRANRFSSSAAGASTGAAFAGGLALTGGAGSVEEAGVLSVPQPPARASGARVHRRFGRMKRRGMEIRG